MQLRVATAAMPTTISMAAVMASNGAMVASAGTVAAGRVADTTMFGTVVADVEGV